MTNNDLIYALDNRASRSGFNGRPLVQWLTRPLGGWALEAPGPREPRKAKFWLVIAKS